MRVFALAAPSLNEFEQAALAPFLSSERHSLCGCAIDMRAPKPLRRRLRENLRRGRGGYVVVMAATLPMRRQQPSVPTRMFCESHDIPVIETASPYGAETLNAIEAQSPDVLVLVGGFGIVRQPLLNLAKHGILSFHHGDMRHYRGQPPALWEIYNGERQMGVTVQRLNEALDAGEPIVERIVPIGLEDTVGSLRARAMTASRDMLYEGVERLEQPALRPPAIHAFGPIYTLPNLRQWMLLNARVAARRVRGRMAADQLRRRA